MNNVVSIVSGRSNVGKTTLIEKILKELSNKGYNVATIKHDVHGFDIDKPGKDTWRHKKAGAKTVTISSSKQIAIIKSVDKEMTLEELIDINKDADLIIVEGFKHSHIPKIEVLRRGFHEELVCRKEDLIAVASDMSWQMGNVPNFHINDGAGIAQFIEENIIKRIR